MKLNKMNKIQLNINEQTIQYNESKLGRGSNTL